MVSSSNHHPRLSQYYLGDVAKQEFWRKMASGNKGSITGLSLDTDGVGKEGAMSDQDRQPDEADRRQATEEQTTDSGRSSGTFVSARQAFGRSFDRLTGTEFRRQFEEFSNVVTSTVLGIHRDQSELSERLERIEQTGPQDRTAEMLSELNDRLAKIEQTQSSNTSSSKLVKATLVFSLVAVILGIVALVIAVSI